MTAYINQDGCLVTSVRRDERWAQAKELVRDGLADESEFARLLCALDRDGLDATRRRLEARRELLAAAEPIVADFFAFEAAVRL